MKKLFIILLAVVTFLLLQPQSSFAQMGMMGNFYNNDASSSSSQSQIEQQYQQNLQNLTNDILKAQKVSAINQIDCKKVSNDQFEKVGDAWMDVRIGNEAIHQQMDNMMGGEGSQSLTNSHIQMGESYLSCQTNGANYGWMPMMFGVQNNTTRGGGLPMMGFGGYGYNGMMGLNGSFGFFGALAFVGWLVVLIDLILVGIWLWKQIKKK